MVDVGDAGGKAMSHATVIRDGYEVPLIGVPPEAVLEKCDLCGDEFPQLQVSFENGQMLCEKCRKECQP